MNEQDCWQSYRQRRVGSQSGQNVLQCSNSDALLLSPSPVFLAGESLSSSRRQEELDELILRNREG